MKTKDIIAIIFVIFIMAFFIFAAASLIIHQHNSSEAAQDFCHDHGMDYLSKHYCIDGNKAVDIIYHAKGSGLKKSDYKFYFVGDQ